MCSLVVGSDEEVDEEAGVSRAPDRAWSEMSADEVIAEMETGLRGILATELRIPEDEVADAWAPYLTTAEGIRIVAKAFTTDVSMLSCCA